MGYSGAINFNGISLFSEGKNYGKYCMNYAENYNKQKPAKLTIKAIEECIKNINGGVTSYSSTMHCIRSAGNIIEKLGDMLDGGFNPHFDENGNFLLIAKMQNSDSCGNSKTINYYKKDKVSEVPEVEFEERKFLTDEDMEDMKRKRNFFIDTINVFSTLDGLERKIDNEREVYKNFVYNLKNIKTRNDVFALLEEVNVYYKMLNEIYYEKYTFALKLTKMLESCKEMINKGEEVFAKCKGNELYLYSSKKYAKITYNKFFDIADLFDESGTSTSGSSCYITTLEDFKILIESFEYMKREKRSPYIERILKEQYDTINTGSRREFKLYIGGGY